MKEDRNDARPRLKVVNEALDELFEMMCRFNIEDRDRLKQLWDSILNKHDINYNDKNRWSDRTEYNPEAGWRS